MTALNSPITSNDIIEKVNELDARESLPSQTGHAGQFLTTDGSGASWGVVPNPLPDQTGNAGKLLTTNGINASWMTKDYYRSLSDTQATTLLDNGTYNGEEVASGEIFTTEDGAFKEYIKETIGFGIDATTLSDLIWPCNETAIEHGEEVLYAPTGNNALFLRSTNKGKTWTPVSSGRASANYQNRLYHFNGVFYAIYGGYDGGGSYNYWVDYSSDLQNWSTSQIYHGSSPANILAPSSNAIATSTHIFIGISNGQYGDACFRAELPLSPTSTWTSIQNYGAATGIISEFNGKLVTGRGYSLDNGDTWNDNNVYYGNGVYFIKGDKMYAVGRPSFSSNGYLWESTDGITFTDLGQFTDNGVSAFFLDKAVAVEGDDYAYGALGGTLYYADLSDNVKTWTAVTGFDVYQALIETEPSVLFSVSDTYNTQQGIVGIQYNRSLTPLSYNKDEVDALIGGGGAGSLEDIAEAGDGIKFVTGYENFFIIGSGCTVTDGIATGFDWYNTKTGIGTGYLFKPQSNTWEIQYKIKTGSSVSGSQFIEGSQNQVDCQVPYIAVEGGKFKIWLSSNGSTHDLASGASGTYSVQASTEYYIRLSWDGSKYVLAYSTDGTTFTDDITITSSTPVYSATTGYIGVGIHVYDGTNNSLAWQGDIDLNKTFVKIGNNIDWRAISTLPTITSNVLVINGYVPDYNTPGYLGQICIEKISKQAYICVEVDKSVPTYTWKQITS